MPQLNTVERNPPATGESILSMSHFVESAGYVGIGHPWQRSVKRAMDIVIALTLLLVTLPVMLAVALAIRLDSPGSIIFRQARLGRGGRPFTLYKFRSMYADAEFRVHELRRRHGRREPTFKLADDPRVTRVGRLIRRLSLDELPQLYNVLRGDMSMVGPRPAILYEVEEYQPWQRIRLLGFPGLSGMWQVSGRSRLGFDEMVHLDLDYLRRWSLRLDLVILIRTIPAVLFGRGAM